MVWTYNQSTGELRHNGQLFRVGYSGHGAGINNSAMEGEANIGPIPRGQYRITGHSSSVTPYTIILQPTADTNTFGRTDFRIHGGSRDGSQTASQGCIIIDGVGFRQQIIDSNDTDLRVE